MYKVIIIDDEKLILEGLKELIDWEKYGFTVTGLALNGEDGINKAKETRADLIVTDIKMPYISGHDLIDKVKAFNPDCKFIMMSGYSNFKYVQEAMNKGAYCYLLKPIQEDELCRNLEAIKKELDSRKEEEQELSVLQQKLQESLPVVRERYLCDLVQNETLSPQQVQKKWEFLNTGYNLDTFEVFVIEGDSLEQKYADDMDKIVLINFSIENIVSEMVSNEGIGVTFRYQQERIAVICCRKDGGTLQIEKIKIFAKKIQNRIQELLKESVSIGMGRIYSSPDSMRLSFQEAEKALQYKLLYGDGCLIDFHEIPLGSQQVNYPLQLEKELLSYVEMGRGEDAEKTIHQMFKNFSDNKRYVPDTIYAISQNILVVVMRCVVQCGIPYEELNSRKEISLQNLSRFKTISELENFVSGKIVQYTDRVRNLRSLQQKGVLGEIQIYIKQHYQEDINLEFLARKFYLNSSYLSQLFKKETGFNFLDFLADIRIEHAKQLLLDPTFKIYEVGSSVGYNNARYFSQLFEKYTGMTPSDYRKKVYPQ